MECHLRWRTSEGLSTFGGDDGGVDVEGEDIRLGDNTGSSEDHQLLRRKVDPIVKSPICTERGIVEVNEAMRLSGAACKLKWDSSVARFTSWHEAVRQRGLDPSKIASTGKKWERLPGQGKYKQYCQYRENTSKIASPGKIRQRLPVQGKYKQTNLYQRRSHRDLCSARNSKRPPVSS